MTVSTNSISLEERVYLLLEEEILTGKLKPGEQLREIALAKRLEASRTPIRSALHRLAEEGLVELMANRGATVVGITSDDIKDIYAVRMRPGLHSQAVAWPPRRSAGRRESGSQRPWLGEAAPQPEGSSVCAQQAPARLVLNPVMS